jgi:isoamylase
MVTDSLRYWVEETHIDGCRFDLGTILAREPNGFENRSGFLKACSQDPVLGTVKLIAAVGLRSPAVTRWELFLPGGPSGTTDFETRFEISGEGLLQSETWRPRLCASPQQFDHQGRRPWSCVNFITAHDGFTLNDLVSYNDKHNEANGEDNKDGSSNNRSWNCGVEGPIEVPGIQRLRERQIRNFLGTLLIIPGHAHVAGGG